VILIETKTVNASYNSRLPGGSTRG